MTKNIRHFVCVYFPEWAITVTRRNLACTRPHPPQHGESLHERQPHALLLVSAQEQQLIVRRACSMARSYGVAEGMNLALAKAHLPETFSTGEHQLLIRPFDPRAHLRALHALAVQCTVFSPLVALEQEVVRAFRTQTLHQLSPLHEGIIIEVTGTARVHGGFDKLLTRLTQTLARRAIPARCALAPTIGAAWALSRYGIRSGEEKRILPEASYVREALAPLPLAALRLPDATSRALEEVGITTIGSLCTLPRKQVGLRYGIQVLTRLDQAFGAVEEPIRGVRIPTTYTLRRRFEVPLTTRQSVHLVIVVLLERLLATLAARKRAARSFMIRVEGRDEQGRTRVMNREITLFSPQRSRAAVASVLQPIVEDLSFPEGVHLVSVTARSTERITEGQRDYLDATRTAEYHEHSSALINNLVIRLGPERVCGMRIMPSYIPERAFQFESVARVQGNTQAVPVLTTFERPTYLLEKPEQIEALSLLPDKPPSVVAWRGVRYRILKGSGPERLADEWWHAEVTPQRDPSQRTRDYFKVQDHTGRWLWVFRDNDQREWFVHGLWQ